MSKKAYCYEWPRPALTVDVALFGVTGALNDLHLQVLLIERNEEPWRGRWALPGGFVRENEDLDELAPLLTLLRRFATEAAREEARLFCDELAALDYDEQSAAA